MRVTSRYTTEILTHSRVLHIHSERHRGFRIPSDRLTHTDNREKYISLNKS